MRFTTQFQSTYFTEWHFKFFNALVVLAYIVCAMNLPVTLMPTALHDDGLFFRLAYSVVQGEWLGDYNETTLAKGPTYPFFLAANAAAGVPITLSLAMLYAFSCWLLTSRLVKLDLPHLLALGLMVLLLFHPYSFPERIIRDNIYPALTLVVLAATIDVCLLRQRSTLILLLYGIAAGSFWMTREEGVWVLPPLLILVAAVSATVHRREGRQGVSDIAGRLVILMGSALILVLCVCSLNYAKYGAFVVVDFKEQYFAKSLSLLNSIEPTKRTLHVPVNSEQRALAYEVSPAFAELQQYLEVEGQGWTNHGCAVYPHACGDFAGGWFMWAYRSAVARIDRYDSFASSAAFYADVAQELELACTSGTLRCKDQSFGFLPNLYDDNFRLIPQSLSDTSSLLLMRRGAPLRLSASTDFNQLLPSVRLFLRHPLSMPSKQESARVTLVGYYFSTASAESWLKLLCQNKQPQRIKRRPSFDLRSQFPESDIVQSRFFITADNADSCELITDTGGRVALMDLTDRLVSPDILGPETILHTEVAVRGLPTAIINVSVMIKSSLNRFYRLALPILALFGGVALAASFAKACRNGSLYEPLLMVALVSWLLVASRISLLVLIDISSFPAINSLYMAPAFPLFTVACLTSIAAFLQTNGAKEK
jgi:hypothetical protein